MSKKIPFEKSFASSDKAKYWSDKNELKPAQVALQSNKKFWFNCSCGHELIQAPNHIFRGNWCVYCSNQKLCDKIDCNQCFEKSFASHDKSKFLSSINNINPRMLFKSSPNKKYIFDCECGHNFETRLSDITRLNGNTWCSYCSSKLLCSKEDCKQCFEKSFASHENVNYWSDTNNVNPRMIFKQSNKKYIFHCSNCNHDFESIVSNILKGQLCSYCCNPPRNLCDKEDCKECFEKSFASSDKIKYWNSKNKINPRNVFKGCNKPKFIFNCNCSHEFDTTLNNIMTGFWCPYCCTPPKKLCDKEDCKQCFEKSFASSDKAIYWSDKNQIIPRQVLKGSGNSYLFNCKCGHEFITCINYINRGNWCIYCSNQKLCDKEDCKQCFEKSFASSDKAIFWADKNKLKPINIFKSSNFKYWFKCNKGHEFDISPNAVKRNNWCRYCVNKTEQKLFDNLQPIYSNLQQQYKVDWCKSNTTKKCYPFDFILEEHKIIIELDGRQHFEQVSNWDSPDKVQERDKYKMKKANDNGY